MMGCIWRTAVAGIVLATLAMPATAISRDRRDGGRGVSSREAVDAAIVSDISRGRQEERDDERAPYASPGHGPIRTARQASDACIGEALGEVGGAVKVLRAPYTRQMATGWEVEGEIDQGRNGEPIPFVCSVRNGSVSGVVIR